MIVTVTPSDMLFFLAILFTFLSIANLIRSWFESGQAEKVYTRWAATWFLTAVIAGLLASYVLVNQGG